MFFKAAPADSTQLETLANDSDVIAAFQNDP
jgi:hypothetical protein